MNESLRNNLTYLSSQSQNEMIDAIGKKMIQKGVIEERKVAGFHSISADEVIGDFVWTASVGRHSPEVDSGEYLEAASCVNNFC